MGVAAVYMTAWCGAWQIGTDRTEGAVQFRLFFPRGFDTRLSAITVGGSFQSILGGVDWDFAHGLPMARDTNDASGDYWTASTAPLPAGFYEYKYEVVFDDGDRRVVTDPCARYGGLSDENSAIVVGGSTPEENQVRPLKTGRKPLSELVIYELMIDDFTAEYRAGKAPLDAVIDKLDVLVADGVSAILFMPWTSWHNTDFDWGYDPFQYFAVEARYANAWGIPEEKLSWLKRLISACHDRDIHVIMDGVYNHAGPAFPYPQFYRDPGECPFTARAFGGQFPGLLDLDFHNECTNEFVLDVCTYWIETFGIDGIRFDNTVNYFDKNDPLHGLPEILPNLSSWLDDKDERNFSLTIEHIDICAATVTNDTSASSFWDDSLYQVASSGLITRDVDAGLLNALNNRRFLADGKLPTLYLSNHDHSQIAWYVTADDPNSGITGEWWRLQPYLIALFTTTGVPLVPNGQEFGSDHFLPNDDHGTGRRVLGRPVQWKARTDAIGTTLTALHRALARLRAERPALRSPLMYPSQWDTWQTERNSVGVGVDLHQQVAVYHRWAPLPNDGVDNIVVVLNFSDSQQTINVPFPVDGRWDDLLDGFDAGGSFWSLDVVAQRADVPVGSHWGRILGRLNRI